MGDESPGTKRPVQFIQMVEGQTSTTRQIEVSDRRKSIPRQRPGVRRGAWLVAPHRARLDGARLPLGDLQGLEAERESAELQRETGSAAPSTKQSVEFTYRLT